MNHGSNHFIPWLRAQLDAQTYEGCQWVERDRNIFKIAWPRAAADVDSERALGVMYAWYTHKFGDSRLGIQPTAVKGNFRSCLNSKKREIVSVRDNRDGNIVWKIMQFVKLPVDDKKRQREMRIMENRQLNRQPAAATGSRHVSGESVGRVHTISNEGFQKQEMHTPPHSSYMNPHCPYIPVQGDHGPMYHDVLLTNNGASPPYYNSNPVSPAPEERVVTANGWFSDWYVKQQILEKKTTLLRIEVYNKGVMKATQDFPNMENQRVHVFFDRRRQEALWAPVGQDCLEFPFTFDIVTDRMKSLCKHFNPGVIVSCDQYANIGLQRMSPGHIYYSNGQERTWIKLEKPRRDPETHAPLPDPPQHVFSLSEYIHVAESYAGFQENNIVTPLEPLPSEILMTIADYPKHGCGFNDCDLGIKIIHSKAEEYYQNRIKPLLPSDGPELKISDDLSKLTVEDGQPFDMQNIIQHAYFLPDIDLESVMEDLLQETSPELLLLDPATELYLDQDNDKNEK